MNQLPNDKNLSIEKLAACFNSTSATYKFYWLLSIVDAKNKFRDTIQTLVSIAANNGFEYLKNERK